MECLISTKNLSKVEWHRRVPADAILQTVLVDFCDRFCLPTCQMLHNDRLLHPDQKLIQLERDAANVLQLQATFVPSITYCMWYNFRQLNVKGLNEEALSIMWQTAVHAFCKQQITYAQFSALLAASSHAFPMESKEVEPLLLLQHFLAINAKAALASDMLSGHSSEPITFLWGSLGNATAPGDAVLRSFQQYAQAMTGPEAAKLSHVGLVRSALLLIHLLGLVKMVTPGIGAVEEALWRTVAIIGEQLGPAAAGAHASKTFDMRLCPVAAF